MIQIKQGSELEGTGKGTKKGRGRNGQRRGAHTREGDGMGEAPTGGEVGRPLVKSWENTNFGLLHGDGLDPCLGRGGRMVWVRVELVWLVMGSSVVV